MGMRLNAHEVYAATQLQLTRTRISGHFF